jgi:hypothetical protein
MKTLMRIFSSRTHARGGRIVGCGFLALMLGACALVAQPAEVILSAPTVTVGDLWLLDTDPTHDALRVNVAFSVTRNQPAGQPRDIPVRLVMRLVASSPGNPVVGFVKQTELIHVPPIVK